MSKQVIKMETYKKEREEKFNKAQKCFESIDSSYENCTTIMEKLKETKNSVIINKIPVNESFIKKIAKKIEKKYKK